MSVWANLTSWYAQHPERPWWRRAARALGLQGYWWHREWGPRALWADARAFWQRGRRGWADRDTWSLDSYLAGVIAGSVRHLADTTHGCPCDYAYRDPTDFDTYDPLGHGRWAADLRTLADEFQQYHDGLYGDAAHDTAWYDARIAAMHRLFDYYGNLWD